MSIAQKAGFAAALGMALVAFGCGTGETPPQGIAAASKTRALPAASIAREGAALDDERDSADDELQIVVPEEGTPEWLVHEAMRLLLEPPPESDDLEVLKEHRRERNEEIIRLAKQAIEATRGQEQKERLLAAAAHALMEARLQLALTGEANEIKVLYEDAESLFQDAPQSAAAAEGAQALVNLAYTNAKSQTDGDTDWLREFARQARHFAGSFPGEARRSLPLLFTAARSCELAGFVDEARECCELIQEGFPNTPFAARAGPILRRLKLVGNRAQLAGPTLDGEPLALEDFSGQIVLVVFWSTEVRPFLEQLPALEKTAREYSARGVRVLGVNLDQELRAVQDFILERRLSWPQIFFPDPEKRGWNNPIADYYGIRDIPAIWLVDRGGLVVSTNLKAGSLAEEIEKLLKNDE